VSFLIVMVLLLVVMYVLMIRPQRQRQRDQQSMVDGAGVGDDILTSGGIYGTITRAEGDDVVVEIADGLSVHMTRRGIAAVLPPEDEGGGAAVLEAEAVEEPDDDESPVTTSEEAVTSDADAGATAADRR
jgi:preprotein translocase subunit YajC